MKGAVVGKSLLRGLSHSWHWTSTFIIIVMCVSRPCFPSDKPNTAPDTPLQEEKTMTPPSNVDETPTPVAAPSSAEKHEDRQENAQVQDSTKAAATEKVAHQPAGSDQPVESKDKTDQSQTVTSKQEPASPEPTQPSPPPPAATPEKPSAPSSDDTITAAESHPSEAAPGGDGKVAPLEEDVKFGPEIGEGDEEEDMPSFEEWKKKMLHEQEKEKKSKQITQPIQASVNTPNQVTKNRVNYAAMACGAKVLSVNPESQFASYILSENKDQYMINPCKAKKWFVIELCEPVQVKRLEIANLELFSSTPASFIMQISDRYPTKEWRTVGTFHARDERNIQVFLLSDEQMYAKYIRIEILSHFGDEHYCPLSIVRIFGTSEEEEYEQAEQGGQLDNTAEDSSAAVTDGDKDQPTNLFTSATDTVLSLVKTVLHSKDEEQNATDATVTDDPGKLETGKTGDIPNATTKDQTTGCADKDNGAQKPVDIDTSATATKPQPPSPDITTGAGQDATPPPPAQSDPLVVKIENDNDKDLSGQQTKDSDLVTLIDSPSKLEGGASLQTLLSQCNFCQKLAKVTPCYFDKSSVCGYYRIMTFVYPTSCVAKVKKQNNLNIKNIPASTKPPAELGSEVKKDVDSDLDAVTGAQKTEVTSEVQPAATDTGGQSKSTHTIAAGTQTISSSPSSSSSSSTSSVAASASSSPVSITTETSPPSEPLPTATAGQIKPTPTQKLPDSSADQKLPVSKPQEPAPEVKPAEKLPPPVQEVTPHPPPTLESSQSTVMSDAVTTEKTQTIPGCKVTQGGAGVGCPEATVIQVRPTETTPDPVITEPPASVSIQEPAASEKEAQNVITPEPSKSEKQTIEATKDVSSSPETQKDKSSNGAPANGKPSNGGTSANGGEHKTIYADNATTADSDQQPSLGLEAEEVPVKMSGGKQSTFMRLNNRIKALEVNLSLSSRYLEELSQRYRKKMEEMYASLDFAIDQLAETAKSAEERDQKQQENISILQTQIHNLTEVVARLSDDMGSLQHQMIERHLFLMLAEVLIFMVVMATCITRNSERLPPTKNELLELRKLIRNMPDTPHVKRHRRQRSDETMRPRSSSSITLTEKWDLDDINLRPSGSDSNLTIIPPTIPIFIDSNPSITDLPKKKKKKKIQAKSQLHSTKSAPTALPAHLPSVTTLEASCQDSSAGLLFGSHTVSDTKSTDSDEVTRPLKALTHESEARRSLFRDSNPGNGAKQKHSSNQKRGVSIMGLSNGYTSTATNGPTSHRCEDHQHRKDTHKHRTESHPKREKSDACVQTQGRGRVERPGHGNQGQTHVNDHAQTNGHDSENSAWRNWFPSQKR